MADPRDVLDLNGTSEVLERTSVIGADTGIRRVMSEFIARIREC
jgi:hypothetical protein